MTQTSKLALIAALAAMSIASPALAQSFNPRDGTGNELPLQYGCRRRPECLGRTLAK